jgi:NADH dehydrogenase
MKESTVTVFGGTGFLGRRVVLRLRAHGFFVRDRIEASRSPPRAGYRWAQLESFQADIHDERSVAEAVAGAYGVVNAVSLYVERGNDTFHSVHVESAKRVAAQALSAGVERLVHVSGIGAAAGSQSLYIRKRGEGELAVRAAFSKSILIRPGVMFGLDDAFLTTVLELLRRLPAYPMFGGGITRLQPVYVEDVAEAVAAAVQQPDAEAKTFECGGPRVYTYADFLRSVAREAGLRPILMPFPFAAWHALAWMSELLPKPTITRNQVELMQIDTIARPGLEELGISPHTVEEILHQIMSEH